MPDADASSPVLTTKRLTLYRFTLDDAPFAFSLVTDASFVRYIGDKGVRTLDDARNYLKNGPIASYERHGFGLFKVVRNATGEPVGMCGLLKRDTLEDVDLGYAFMPAFWSHGYGAESAAGVIDYGRRQHGLTRLVAITQSDNLASIRVLERSGFAFERVVQLGPEPTKLLRLFGLAL
jgi:RimJ/RimL family protein N-acetyltransferase